jgi:hypothetical protein
MRRARVTKGVCGGLHSGLQRIVANAVGDHLIGETTASYCEPGAEVGGMSFGWPRRRPLPHH